MAASPDTEINKLAFSTPINEIQWLSHIVHIPMDATILLHQIDVHQVFGLNDFIV